MIRIKDIETTDGFYKISIEVFENMYSTEKELIWLQILAIWAACLKKFTCNSRIKSKKIEKRFSKRVIFRKGSKNLLLIEKQSTWLALSRSQLKLRNLHCWGSSQELSSYCEIKLETKICKYKISIEGLKTGIHSFKNFLKNSMKSARIQILKFQRF